MSDSVRHLNHYTKLFSVLVWGCNSVTFIAWVILFTKSSNSVSSVGRSICSFWNTRRETLEVHSWELKGYNTQFKLNFFAKICVTAAACGQRSALASSPPAIGFTTGLVVVTAWGNSWWVWPLYLYFNGRAPLVATAEGGSCSVLYSRPLEGW